MKKLFFLSIAALWVSSVLGLSQTAPNDMQLILLIGQSNMAGRGVVEPQDQVTTPQIFMLNKYYDWVLAKDPVHFDRPGMIGVGLCSEFARTLVKADPKITVGLIPAAMGGTSLNEWKPGGALYVDAVARARWAMKNGKLAGILWHQGESDINGKPATYNERFAAMVKQLRTDLGAENVPVIVGELGQYLKQPNAAKLRTALSELPKSVPLCAFVSSEGLVPKADNLHFDAPSLRTFGARYAAAWLEMQSWKSAVRVATYQGDRAGAISYTFDDGLRNHYLLAAPMLNDLGLRATFFIIPARVANTKAEAEAKKPGEPGVVCWDELREMAAKGHEMGNHTWSHAGLKKLDDAKAEEQISMADGKIEQEIGIFPASFCFPGNGRDDRTKALALRRHVAARVYETGMGKKDTTPEGLNAWAERQATEHKWGVAMLHGLIDGYDPIDPEVLRAHLTYVKERQNDLWVETFGTIGRYVRERDAAQLQVIGKTAQSVTFILDSPLARPPFDAPLTTVITAPGATAAEAKTRDGRTLPATVSREAVHVECVPGPEPVTVEWKTAR